MNPSEASFEVRRGKEFPRVDVIFGAEKDVNNITRWRLPKNAPQPARDALEFARLASKRWRYYKTSLSTVGSVEDLKSAISKNSRSEVNFILLARATWFSPGAPVGLVLCRRTYCHHIVVEFLASHPRILVDRSQPTRGVGSGLLYSLCMIAQSLQIPLIWGEATELSAPFYQKVFGIAEITDHFFLAQPQLDHCREKFLQEISGEAYFS